MSLVGIEVGQTIFVYDVANGARMGRSGEELQVTKVTKQTVYARQFGKTVAFDLAGNQKQDAYCHHRAWRSRAEFDAERERGKAWSELRDAVRYGSAPDHVSTEQIQQILSAIKGKA